jgi:hypothetical protein
VPYPYKNYSGLSLFVTLRDYFSAPRYIGGILYAHSIVEEVGPNNTLCQQVGTTPTLRVGTSFIEIFHGNGLADVALSLSILVFLTSHRFIYPSEGI